ncbi:hypothetical protein DVU_1293 [Nitratidesulfovibrio vulgaris str. Hildenborough]|uniref:Uncharacterized protein n=1 Tax=Nitratidesulfovibrio vulgaris (strain ATCC 29579 / DSM 644 / CCUG 34227 / NCIMB 8303 / VKM B-1760 / Hildenborough) TaxID=882 RepID=Q72CJ0_NITV2|nr:hypothetical protein DVU_1293 [Nitratidesulfovibrio vulgaris str. Hildenborough]
MPSLSCKVKLPKAAAFSLPTAGRQKRPRVLWPFSLRHRKQASGSNYCGIKRMCSPLAATGCHSSRLMDWLNSRESAVTPLLRTQHSPCSLWNLKAAAVSPQRHPAQTPQHAKLFTQTTTCCFIDLSPVSDYVKKIIFG